MNTTVSTRNFPIMAGMQFTYPKTKGNKIKAVGYYTVEFKHTLDGALVSEKVIKRVFKANPL